MSTPTNDKVAESRDPQHVDDLIYAIAEDVYDDAHENCGEDGCTGGGMPYYWAEVRQVLALASRQPRDELLAVLDHLAQDEPESGAVSHG